jgi:hypothetical protein
MADSEDDCWECLVCLQDVRTGWSAGAIWQCPEGHLLCAGCYDTVGGAASPCPSCDTPLGAIRNRVAEKQRDRSAKLPATADPSLTAAQEDAGSDKKGVWRRDEQLEERKVEGQQRHQEERQNEEAKQQEKQQQQRQPVITIDSDDDIVKDENCDVDGVQTQLLKQVQKLQEKEKALKNELEQQQQHALQQQQ